MLESLESRTLLTANCTNAVAPFIDSTGAEGEDVAKIVSYCIETVVAGTNTPLTTITNGRDFDLRVTVQDLRDDGNPNRGVYAAYLDVIYEKPLAKVRVPEVQRLTITSNTAQTGTFTLTLNPNQTTAPINYSRADSAGQAATAADIQAKLNNLLGAGSVLVNQVIPLNSYDIRFVGQADVDQPILQPSITGINVSERFKGDPNNATSFAEAFRSYSSPYQSGLSAGNGVDRIDELGAQLDSQRIGTGVFELVRARMTATLPAGDTTRIVTFTPSFSQLLHPEHDTLVYADLTGGERSLVPPEAIEALCQTSLTITTALTAASGVAQVDEDQAAGVNIPAISLVTKNAGAPAGAVELRRFTQPATGGTVQRLDNNTPNDFSDDQLKFIPALNFTGNVTFTYTAGIVGDPLPVDEATNSITITVSPINDAPENNVPGPQTTPEDAPPLVFSVANNNPIRVNDVDADPAGVRVSLAVSSGTLSLSGTSGLTFTLGTGTNNAIMTFTGTTIDVNAALAGMTYQPPSNFSGSATLTITSNDLVAAGSGGLKQDQDAVSITVTATNDPPVVTAPGSQTAFTLNALVFSSSFNNAISVSDLDAGSDAISLTVTAAGGIGNFTATGASGAIVSGLGTASVTLSGSVSAVNGALNGLTLTPPSTAASGTITIVANDQGHNPAPPQSGQAIVAVTVAVPSGPFAVNDSPVGLVEGQASYTIDVLSNDLATSGNKAVIVSFTQPQIGTVTLDNNSTPGDATDDKLVYRPPLKNGQPDLDFFTPQSLPPVGFLYVVNQSPNAGADSPPAGVSIRITNEADTPVANNDGLNNTISTSIGVPLSRSAAQGLLANDTSSDNAYGDANVAALSVVGASANSPLILTTAANGSVTVNADGSFNYIPAAGFGGNDTFTYRAKSSLGPESNTATVTLHVSAPPTARVDNYTQAQEDQVFVSPVSVLLNDSDDSDGESLTAVLVSNVPPAAGSVSLGSDGNFTYTPAGNFNTTRPPAAAIQFTYKAVTQNGRESAPTTVSITVNDTNDNPRANGDIFEAVQRINNLGVDQLVSVLGNDSGAPDVGETLVVTGVNGASADASGNAGPVATSGGGSVRLQGFQIRYTSPNVTGSDSFTYTISDGRGGTATATVEVNVLPPFDYGDAQDTYGTLIFSNGARHFATGPLLGTARDVEGNGVSSASADGDDLAGQDDEDGLTGHLLLRGKTSGLTVVSDGPGKLDAWIDFDRNGAFAASEQVAASVNVVAGSNAISFNAPATALLGQTIARLRISTAGGLAPAGQAQDGEVEDHVVTVLQDLEVTLPTGNGLDRVSIRKNNADIEVFNALTASVMGASPLQFTHAVIVNGSETEPDEITMDYAFGGIVGVPAGIHLRGGASGGDTAILQGPASGNAGVQYLTGAQSLGNSSLQITDGTSNSEVALTGIEPLTIQAMNSFQALGALNVGADTLTLSLSSPANLGTSATLTGGTINATGGIALAANQKLSGAGTVNARIAGAAGSTIEATGPLTLGDPSSPTGFVTAGEIKVGSNSVTLLSSAAPVLGSLTTLGAGGSGGTLNSLIGLLVPADSTIQGLGTINTPNDATKAVLNSGTIRGNSAGEKLTVAGFLTGLGTLDNVIITGTYSPGASPAAVQLGSISFGSTAKLIVELGGKTAGSQFDQLNSSGAIVLGGTLEVVLLNNFVPTIHVAPPTPTTSISFSPDSFTVINATAGVTGSFASSALPALSGRQRWWNTTPVGNEVRLLVAPTHPRHNPHWAFDVTGDGFVVAGDALEIINYINARFPSDVAPSPAYISPLLDVSGGDGQPDNFIAPNDALEIINLINAGLNRTPPAASEGEAIASPAAAPSTLADTIALLAFDLAEQQATRRRRAL